MGAYLKNRPDDPSLRDSLAEALQSDANCRHTLLCLSKTESNKEMCRVLPVGRC